MMKKPSAEWLKDFGLPTGFALTSSFGSDATSVLWNSVSLSVKFLDSKLYSFVQHSPTTVTAPANYKALI